MTRTSASTYRLEPLDTSGVFLGLGLAECALVGLGTLGAAIALTFGLHVVLAAIPLVLAATLSFVRFGRHTAWEWLTLGSGWAWRIARGRRWTAPLPLWSTEEAGPAPMPPCLAGIELVEAHPPGGRPIGCVHDVEADTLTAIVPVSGVQILLEPDAEQADRLARWGATLGQLAGGRSVVTHVAWSQLSHPSTLVRHVEALRRASTAVDRPKAAVESYSDLLDAAAAAATEHDVVVTVTVARRRLRARQRGGDHLADALVGAVEAVRRSLASAGVDAGEALDGPGIRTLMRKRVDPVTAYRPRRGGRLGERVGSVAPSAAGPLVTEAAWRHLRADAAWHRTYWVASWPQVPVPPMWLEPFLAIEGVTRSTTVAFLPVAAHESRRRIRRELVKLETDAADKHERGRRVDARHQQVSDALLGREQELVAGFTEVAYVGLVTVTAADEDELDDHCELVEQVASEAGIDLRVLDGRQDVAWAATLPLGLGVSELVGA